MPDLLVSAVFATNAIWFGLGFIAFYIRREVFAKIVVPISADRNNSAYAAVIESGRFMGGFNFALSVLNLGLFFNLAGLQTPIQMSFLLAFNALAHGSQFFGNVPMALKNMRGAGIWNVFKGVMLQIFVIDFLLMATNLAFALALLV